MTGSTTGRPMTIGAFARRSRLSAKALRLYDRIGLLVPADTDAVNGYRYYAEDQLFAARLISRLRRLDLPLTDIASVLSAPAGESADRLTAVWESIEARMASRRWLAAYLIERLQTEAGASGAAERKDTTTMYSIEERDVAEVRVASELRHIRSPELSPWIDQACGRLYKAVGQESLAGPMFVIYHGEVTEDSDGPAEVCLTISPAAEVDASVGTRIIPAHTEAFTRITKAQVEYPQILGAYEAVERWIRSQGREPSGPPREVYFIDFAQAGANDEACDIAWPTS